MALKKERAVSPKRGEPRPPPKHYQEDSDEDAYDQLYMMLDPKGRMPPRMKRKLEEAKACEPVLSDLEDSFVGNIMEVQIYASEVSLY